MGKIMVRKKEVKSQSLIGQDEARERKTFWTKID